MKEETLYVVGMKSYDENGKLIRENYTFVSGPFREEDAAMDSAREKMSDMFSKYKCLETAGQSFHTSEQQNSLSLYKEIKGNNYQVYVVLDVVPISAKVPPILAGSAISASVKGKNSTDEDIIFKRLQRKAQQALASISL